jgi:SSS family solute:Na+ symporter
MNISYLDIGIISVYLVLVFYSGTLMKKYIGGIGDYLVADRSMGFQLGLISLMCSEIGMVTYVYYAEMGYKAGLVALVVAFPTSLAFLIVGRTGFIIKPLMEMRIMTIPEFFSKRFNNGIRLYIGVLMAAGGILNFGVFPGVEANFINIVTGIPQEYVLITMVVMLTIVLLYTIIGGMVSVIITNYLQYALLSIGMVFITIYGIIKIGWNNIIHTVTSNFGEKGINPFFPSLTEGEFGLGFIIWQVLLWTSIIVSWQAISMRLFSSKDAKTGKKIYSWSSLMFLSRAILPVFWGIMALAYLGSTVESLEALPILIIKLVPKGVLGLLLAALLAASMSTYSSYLLSWSSVVSQDLIGAGIKLATGRELSSKKQLLVSRITIAAVMIFIIWWSLFHKIEGYLYFYLNMTGMLFIPGTLVCLTFGIYWHKTRSTGAFFAITLGAIPPLAYLVLPEDIKTAHASELGWGGFLLSLIGMLLGNFLHDLLGFNKQKKNK